MWELPINARKYVFVFFGIIDVVYADPICSEGFGSNGPKVVCNAGNEDYVLGKGLVSDNDRTTAIILKGCRITKIEGDAFSALPALEDIDLSHNSFHVSTGLFDQTPNVRKLNLSDNRIESLPPKVFDPLTKLSSLDLSNNLILGKNLDAQIFEKTRNIEILDLSGNFMSDTQANLLQALQAIKTLKLSRCTLKEVPTFGTRTNLNTMSLLTLSSNQGGDCVTQCGSI